MRKNDVFPSKYLKAADIDHDTVVTIDRVIDEEMQQDDGTKKKKPVAYFRELDKGLVLNVTIWDTIEKMLGLPDSDDWVGHRITLFATEVQSFGEQVMALRVRMRAPSNGTSESRQPAPVPNNALAIRKDAWDTFLKARPGKDVEAITPEWRELLKSVGGDRSAADFTASDWLKVKSRAVPTNDPIANAEPVHVEDDIPF